MNVLDPFVVLQFYHIIHTEIKLELNTRHVDKASCSHMQFTSGRAPVLLSYLTVDSGV